MHKNKTILVAPLNWGLGHATRCIPIIRLLIKDGFEVLLASDGDALALLEREFPELESLELPSYQIEYPKNGSSFKWKMLLRSPKILKAIRGEHKIVRDLVNKNKIQGVISDNRFGLYHAAIPTVFITHQLQVLSGNTTKLTSALHRRYIKRFDTCWVPDFEGGINLTGKLGHPKFFDIPITYIGPLSRLEVVKIPMEYDILVLLSGPEPQRTELEDILLHELKIYKGKVLFVRGKIHPEKTIRAQNHIKVVDFMESTDLEKAINASKLILCRSGYTTIMDLAKLGKKAFFIPTPGQTEQEYLAKRLKKMGKVPFVNQNEFKVKNLSQTKLYSGFDASIHSQVIENLDGKFFSLFKGERKLRSHTKVALYINLLVMGLYNMFHNR